MTMEFIRSMPSCGYVRIRGLFAFMVCLIGFANITYAGTVRGQVDRGDLGINLPGARVSIMNTDYSVATDDKGRFVFAGVPAGTYTLVAEYLGFPSVTATVEIPSTGEVSQNLTLGASVEELEAMVVVGSSAQGQIKALNQQRNSEVLMTIVSSDAIGRFPDQNAAESLQRLPGISIQKDQGEGRFVSIRGIDPDLSNIKIDNVTIPAPEGESRAVALDVIPSEVLNQIEVVKAVRADMDGDAVGGTINIKTSSAFERGHQYMAASGVLSYNDLLSETSGKLKATYSDVFGEREQYGFLLAATYQERKLGSDNSEVDGPWEENTDTDGASALTPAEIEFRNYEIVRERWAVSSAFEVQAAENAYYYIRGMYNYFSDDEARARWELKAEDAEAFQNLTDTQGTAINTEETDREIKDRFEEQEIWTINGGGDVEFGDWMVDFNLAYSHAEENEPDRIDTEWRMEGDDISFMYDYNRRDNRVPSVVGVFGGRNLHNPAFYELNDITNENNTTEEDEFAGMINARYDFDWNNRPTWVKFGAKYRGREKQQDVTVDIYEAASGVDYLMSDVAEFDTRFPFGRNGNGEWMRANRDAARARFKDNPSDFERQDEDSIIDSAADDYQSDEDIIAGYLMGNTVFEDWSLNAGVRVEHTSFETQGNDIVFDADGDLEAINQNTFSKDYTNVLPSVIARYNFSENGAMRASWTNTIARPKFGDAAFRTQTNREDEELVTGNPDLDPYKSMNWDLSFEYYWEPLGYLSVSGFVKNIEDFVFLSVGEESIDVGGEDFDLITFRNGETANILGVELAYQQQFVDLPSPWDGLGVFTNWTFAQSDADIGRSEDVRMPKQSDTTGTIAVSYEKYGFFLRLAGTFRSDFADAFGEDPEDDELHDSNFQWDVTTSYEINNNWTAFAEFININNEPTRRSYAFTGRPLQYEEYSWTANVGIKWRR